MKRHIFNFFLIFLTVSALFSCKNDDKKRLLPAVTGDTGEVILVINNNYWESEVGEELKKILMKELTGVPQPEPIYNIINIPHSGFSKFFQNHRNIIIAKISSEYESAKITTQKEVWAKSQLIVNITAPNDESFINILKENENSLVEVLHTAERNRILDNYRKYVNAEVRDHLKTKYHFSLTVPKAYKLAVDSSDFVWITNENPPVNQGVFIYFYDYNDPNTFTVDYLLNKRDKMLKKYVPGPNPGSYMTTERRFPVEFVEFMDEERYYAQLKGLYKVENGFYGGPFISLSTVDEKRRRVITVEGFVFAPNKEKRQYLCQLEAILYTLEILP